KLKPLPGGVAKVITFLGHGHRVARGFLLNRFWSRPCLIRTAIDRRHESASGAPRSFDAAIAARWLGPRSLGDAIETTARSASTPATWTGTRRATARAGAGARWRPSAPSLAEKGSKQLSIAALHVVGNGTIALPPTIISRRC